MPAVKSKPVAKKVEAGAATPTPSNELKPTFARVLKAMTSGGKMSYRDIEAATGLYKGLTAILRSTHKSSLTGLGLTKEIFEDVGGKKRMFFQITAAGKKAASKIKAA